MLYIATVHYKSPRWIDIQARQIREHLSVPHQTWTSLEGISSSYSDRFDVVIEQHGEHAGKLNHLAREICHVAADDDLIMFLDGDAFPISDPMPVIAASLEKAPLVAVRRVENLGEPQPHPCFCVTTVGTWRSIRGDWSLGATWRTSANRVVSDVGGNLRRALELSDTSWVPLLRTNRTNLHPVFFGIYGDIVYHHGAGFRSQFVSRADRARLRKGLAAESPARKLLRHGKDRLLGRSWDDEANVRIGEQSESIFQAIAGGDPVWLTQMQHTA